ncbi:MAG: CtsR family transcriptional regulator [Firmicutes bacterium]|jgi:transcriptional regulator CtsR|nr:CtsR family transcriptional regulator [Bacillota bacterium]
MKNLCDAIEQYIKEMLRTAGEDFIEIRRNSLAEQLGCVPSQINYVLETRFSLERGYLVESRRGGGGYVRIVRRRVGTGRDAVETVFSEVRDAISRAKAEGYIHMLEEEGLVSAREAMLLRRAVGDGVSWVARVDRDSARARILRSMLLGLLGEPQPYNGREA